MASKSFIKSEKIVPFNARITGTQNVPNQKTLGEKSIQELSKMVFDKVQDGNCLGTFGITINNRESVKSGTTKKFDTSHTFDQSKKITKIVTTVHKQEAYIVQINFFSGEEELCSLG